MVLGISNAGPSYLQSNQGPMYVITMLTSFLMDLTPHVACYILILTQFHGWKRPQRKATGRDSAVFLVSDLPTDPIVP